MKFFVGPGFIRMLFWFNKIEIRGYAVFRALEPRAWPFDPELGLRGKAYAVCIINPIRCTA